MDLESDNDFPRVAKIPIGDGTWIETPSFSLAVVIQL